MPRKKKVPDQQSSDNKKVDETPKNLLPENTENKDSITVSKSVQEEDKKPAEPETKKEEIKDDADLVKDPSVIADSLKVSTPEFKLDAKTEPVQEAETTVPKKEEVIPPKADEAVIPSVQEVIPPVPQPSVAESMASPAAPVSVPSVSNVDVAPAAKNPPSKAMLIAGSTLVGLMLLVTGIWVFNSKAINQAKKTAANAKSAVPTVIVPTEIEPTKVATDEVKLDKYPVRVLNGSGIAGEANKVKKILEDAGFKVSQTGNADNYDYKDTEIRAKKNVEKSFLDKLNDTLSKHYSTTEKSLASASESSQLVVVVGSEKAE